MIIFPAQAALLAWAGARRLDSLNTDAVAYLRLASYYVHGPLSLAVSGYWGPMLSWLIAGGMALGLSDLAAARAAMGLSALAFTGAAAFCLGRLKAGAKAQAAGTVLAAAASVWWSVEYIAPDLLAAAWALAALGLAAEGTWLRRAPKAFAIGAAWGGAYLAKAPGLILVGLWLGILAWRRLRSGERFSGAARSFLALAVGLGLTAGPWAAALSAKYGRLTISTAAAAAHAIAGLNAAGGDHPFGRMLHRPEPGRVTSWEDPTSLPYPYWTPWESRAHLRRQAAVCARNILLEARLFFGFDLAGLGLIGLAAAAAFAARARRGGGEAGLIAPWLVAAGAALYLPGYLGPYDQRYFYALYPLLWLCAWEAAACLGRVAPARAPLLAKALQPLVFGSFLLKAALGWIPALGGGPDPATLAAKGLADRIRSSPEGPGPIAGSGWIAGERAALYAAYFLNVPWLGDEPGAPPSRWAASGARWIVLRRERKEAAALRASGAAAETAPLAIALPGGRGFWRPPLAIFHVNDAFGDLPADSQEKLRRGPSGPN